MPNQAMIGGNIRYPTLQGICDDFRASINDTFNNSGGSGTGQGGGAGLIMPNTNPDLLVLLNAAVRDTYAELRNVGAPELILDNYIVSGLPALTAPDPSVQVGLSYAGFFDGFQWHSQWTLPIGLSRMLAVSQRITNSGNDFSMLQHFPAGIPGALQGLLNYGWEMRQGILWMNGATSIIDLRIRCRITYPDFQSAAASAINFSTAYVPLLDSLNAISAKMLVKYARRFAPELLTTAKDAETDYMGKLKLEASRERQSQENQRAGFGDEAVADFAIAWSWL
jgi:hypothetical protein